MDEKYYDAILNIKTESDRVIDPFVDYYPYQPTPYFVLNQLCENYSLNETDHVVDFGCGKGRTLFYFHHMFNAYVCGIEQNEKLYQRALRNRERYVRRKRNGEEKIHFHRTNAENYIISPRDNQFYFFRPFSVHIFRKVLANIVQSINDYPRTVHIILYYPAKGYISILENETDFVLEQEILLKGEFEQPENERILIYTRKKNKV